MTPQQAYTTVINQFNDASGNFVSATEVYNYLWLAECELNRKIKCNEQIDSSSIVTSIGQQTYTLPAPITFLTRVIWWNYRMKLIDFRGIEAMDVYSGNQSTGNPWYYFLYGNTIGLYPTPTQIQQVFLYYIADPVYLAPSSFSFSTPFQFHAYYIDYALWRVFAKDQDIGRANFYKALWNEDLAKAQAEWNDRNKVDRISYVKDIDSYPDSDFGMI